MRLLRLDSGKDKKFEQFVRAVAVAQEELLVKEAEDAGKEEDFEFSEDYRARVDRLIQETDERCRNQRIARKRHRALAASIAILLATTLTVTMSVDAFRVPFLDFLFSTYAKYSTIQNKVDTDYTTQMIPEGWDYIYYPQYLPHGFSLENYNIMQSALKTTYKSDDKGRLYFSQYRLSTKTNNVVDTEKVDAVEVDINGSTGYLRIKDASYTLFWEYDDFRFVLSTEQNIGDLDEKEIITIAKSIKRLNRQVE